VLDLQVTDHFWQNKYLSAKESYSWMVIHKIPTPIRVLFMTLQQMPLFHNISIHSLWKVQKVNYILRVHLPETPPRLLYTIFRENLAYFILQADANLVEWKIDHLHHAQRNPMLSYYERNWALCYKTKLQTLYIYENSWYSSRRLL
jgi:hypothetical protein